VDFLNDRKILKQITKKRKKLNITIVSAFLNLSRKIEATIAIKYKKSIAIE